VRQLGSYSFHIFPAQRLGVVVSSFSHDIKERRLSQDYKVANDLNDSLKELDAQVNQLLANADETFDAKKQETLSYASSIHPLIHG
jgi:hypothetical protein